MTQCVGIRGLWQLNTALRGPAYTLPAMPFKNEPQRQGEYRELPLTQAKPRQTVPRGYL
jgi:hypothetical protein